MKDNRFYISNGNIVDYSEEEPKEMSQQEIVDELNRMQNTNDFFIGENQDLNWQVECLEVQLAKTEKALELAYEYHKQESTPSKWIYHITKEEYAGYFKQQAEKELNNGS